MLREAALDDSRTDRIRLALLNLHGAGDFAASLDQASMGLAVDVDGVGSFRLPPTADELLQLLELAEPSPFGLRDQTLHDDSVRKSKEIPASKVRLDPATWSVRLQRGIDHIVQTLGFPPEVEMQASLQKLVLYEEGGFFAGHRDTERDPSMWGSMVVVLPSSYQGGAMSVSHAGETKTFDTSSDSAARRLAFIGFYADCVHEIHPVQTGCRMALTFSLHARGSARPPSPGQHRSELHDRVRSFFAGGDEWMIVLLDHSYTRQRFGWSELKNLDRTRVDALRSIGAQLDTACFLAFAEVREWFAYGVDDDENDDSPVSRESFGERQGGEVTLSQWLDEAGNLCVGTDEEADDSCVVSVVPSLQRNPYEISGEPWSGNEGGTAEQWYHQAAVVLVPRGGELYEEASKVLQAKPRSAERKVVRRRPKGD